MDGVFNFYKPRGMTSHDAVYFFRRLLKIKKVGHTGTLDPNATGVLPICIGKATRISEYLLEVDKEYIGELSLGFETDTQDGDGTALKSSDKKVTEDEIVQAFDKFRGTIYQTPPMYSALKQNGKKLYELAREGITVERPSRKIDIKDIKILNNLNNRQIIFYTKCSRGTYIRTLCNDIGSNLGTYGYMSHLIRVGVGTFKIENSLSMEYLESMDKEELKNIITPIDHAIKHLSEITVQSDYYNKLINGALIPIDGNNMYKEDVLRVYCNEEFIGIGKIINREDNIYLKMDKVLI